MHTGRGDEWEATFLLKRNVEVVVDDKHLQQFALRDGGMPAARPAVDSRNQGNKTDTPTETRWNTLK